MKQVKKEVGNKEVIKMINNELEDEKGIRRSEKT